MRRIYNQALRLFLTLGMFIIMLGVFGGNAHIAKAADTSILITDVTATAKSTNSVKIPDYVTDSDTTTWWAPPEGGESWVQLDLKKVYAINRWTVSHAGSITASWVKGNTKDFKLQASMDGSSWVDIDEVYGNTANKTDRSVTMFFARYVRIYIITPSQAVLEYPEDIQYEYACIADFNVYTMPTAITSVSIPEDDTYYLGENLDFTVNYTSYITVDTAAGIPYIPLIIDGKEMKAYYVSGSGSQALTFRYIVEGQYNVTIDVGSIVLNSATLKDIRGDAAPTSLEGFIGSTDGIMLDGRMRYAATVVNGTGSGIYVEGDSVSITAGTAPEGMVFDHWESSEPDWITFQDAYSPATAFSMRAIVVTITATYKDATALVTYRDTFVYQNEDGTYNIRFIATIDTLSADEVGFVFSKTQQTPTKINSTVKATTKVYKSITVEGVSVTAESFGGTYIITCSITGIPAGNTDVPVYVRAFSTVDGTTAYTPVMTVTVSSLQNP